MKDILNEKLINKINKIYTKDEYLIIKKWFNTKKRATSFRVNTLKTTNKNIEEILKEKNIHFDKVPYLENWYIIEDWKDNDLWNLDIIKDGGIYLQWITSQLVWEAITRNYNRPKILDLTAAPWWKTTHIAAIYKNTAEIHANELNKIRFDKLNYTINKQWALNIKTIRWDVLELKNKFNNEYFDIIIADLPCSAEWRINLYNEKSYKFLEKEHINKKNYNFQKKILNNTISLLKSWWELIYSTCTLDPLENEWIVHFLLSNYKDLELVDLNFKNSNIFKKWIKSYDKYIFNSQVEKSLRVIPSEKNEWFFIAKFKKA